jgi:hypothetical protein
VLVSAVVAGKGSTDAPLGAGALPAEGVRGGVPCMVAVPVSDVAFAAGAVVLVSAGEARRGALEGGAGLTTSDIRCGGRKDGFVGMTNETVAGLELVRRALLVCTGAGAGRGAGGVPTGEPTREPGALPPR